MSWVPSATRANLRVGVAVLGGDPAAGQHADPALGAAARPRAATANASVQDAGAELAILVVRTCG